MRLEAPQQTLSLAEAIEFLRPLQAAKATESGVR